MDKCRGGQGEKHTKEWKGNGTIVENGPKREILVVLCYKWEL